MPEGRVINITDSQHNKCLRFFVFTITLYQCSNAKCICLYSVQCNIRVKASGLTHIPLLHVVRPNMCDYANMLICPFVGRRLRLLPFSIYSYSKIEIKVTSPSSCFRYFILRSLSAILSLSLLSF